MKYRAAKRLLDIVLSVAALLIAGPVILLGALAVKLTSPGPAFYRARRAGLAGRPFSMYKLRTMRTGIDASNRRITDADDDRITPVGHLLRASRIDELPQFWNVLRGDMSVVGPRPEDHEIVEQYYTPEQRRILQVRPGIVSPVDVDWYPDFTYHDPPPSGTPIEQWYFARHLPLQIGGGIRYVEQQSLLLDLQVILKTLYCVLVRSWRPPPRRIVVPSQQGQ